MAASAPAPGDRLMAQAAAKKASQVLKFMGWVAGRLAEGAALSHGRSRRWRL